MAYAQETRLNRLPEDVPDRVHKLFDVWRAATCGNALPDRKDLSSDTLSLWINDIGIYEYLPDRRDFVVRIDAPNMIAASGENYQGCSPHQIDLDFGTRVHATLLDVIDSRQPAFHIIGVERKVWEEWVRLLLPVQTRDRAGKAVLQILVAHFFYRGR